MDEASEREAFEAWSKANGCGGDLRYKTSCDEYVNLMTHSAWQAWKGRAAVPVVQPPLRFGDYVNAAGILASDMPHAVMQKLQAAIDVAAPLARQEPKPDSVSPVQPSSEAATARDAWYGGNSMDASMLRNLLAVIHGDGGHYVMQHGIEKAAEDAEKLVAERFAAAMSYAAASQQLEDPPRMTVLLPEAAGVTAAHPLHMPTDEQFRFMHVPQHEDYACEKAAIRLFCRLNGITRRLNAQCTAASAECAATQRHITDMLVAHRDMIEAQQRGDGEAEVLAVQRMEAARSAVAGASPCRPRQTDTGEEQLEPFWCHEQSHDRARCEAQCAECAEDGAPASDPDRFIGGAAGDATYAVAPAEATSNVAVSLRNANPARSQEDGYCAASGVQPLKGKSHE